METAAVIGAGLIGRAWAMVFARAGWRVRLHDRDAAQLGAARRLSSRRASPNRQCDRARRRRCGAALARIAAGGVARRCAGRRRLGAGKPAGDAGRQARGVRRARPRRAAGRRAREFDVGDPGIALHRGLPGRARCLVAHPVNPPHLVPVVELCGAPWTAPATIERAHAVMTRDRAGAGRRAAARSTGFILNRLQGALLAEAMRLVGEGYVSAAGPRQDDPRRPRPALVVHGAVRDDRAQRAGRHRRLLRALRRVLPPPRGQIRRRPRCGMPPRRRRWPRRSGRRPTPQQRDARTAWRDRRLMALAAHKRNNPNPN